MILIAGTISFINIPNIRHFYTSYIRSYLRIGPHNFDVLCVIFGSLLGDAHMYHRVIQNGDVVSLAFKQSIIHKDYLLWLYSFFNERGYCSNNLPSLYNRTIAGYDKTYQGYEFKTYSFTSLFWIYSLFYINGVKVVPACIGDYMTPLTLAIWISDDGGWVGYGVKLSTHSFSLNDVELLVSVLKMKFDLNCTIQPVKSGTQHQIYIKADSVKTLISLVLPYLHPSMHHKLGL